MSLCFVTPTNAVARLSALSLRHVSAYVCHSLYCLLTKEIRKIWAPSGMLRRVALVRTDVSEELSAYFIRVTRIGELGTTLAVTSNWRALRKKYQGGAKFLRNVGSYKSHTASYPRRRNSSKQIRNKRNEATLYWTRSSWKNESLGPVNWSLSLSDQNPMSKFLFVVCLSGYN
jgi:hypothetical protein